MPYTSELINQEALDSQVYNPTVDGSVLVLQQIMEQTPPPTASATQVNPPDPLIDVGDTSVVSPELRPHVETFLGLSTTNPYHGVIVNPAVCLIDATRADLADLPTLLDQLSTEQPSEDLAACVDQTNAATAAMQADLDSLEDHTNRLTSNLPSLAGVAQGALALSTVMNLLSNPCLGLDGLLGSIMDSGKKLLGQITSQIRALRDLVAGKLAELTQGVRNAIGTLIQQVNDMVSVAQQAIASAIAKAKAEIMNFAKGLLAQARQGLAELLANLPSDPCLRGLLQSAVTGAAAAVIK